MSLYDGISVETAPVPEMAPKVEKTTEDKSLSGWSSGLKLMASQLQRNKKALKATQQPKVKPSASAVTILQLAPPPPVITVKDFMEDDLALELQDEYDPLVPNNYELIYQERKAKQDKIREEERKRRHAENDSRRRRRRSGSDSDSDDDRRRRRSRRKDAAAIPPPSNMAVPPPSSQSKPPEQKQEQEEKPVVQSALQELSKKKARKANPFGKPKFGSFASKIMSKYGWEEGKGLGKASQGISTALSVEKTSKRGGKIVNMAAEQEQQAEQEAEQEKQKEQSMLELMKNPCKVVLLQNMVGPGDVDEELEPEVAEECAKYGEVAKCLIFEIPHGVPEEEAVRIFVEFARVESAIKAVVDLNGRFFGGRMVRASFYSEERFSKFDLAP